MTRPGIEPRSLGPLANEPVEKNQNNTKFDEFIMKINIEHFNYNNLFQDFKFMQSVVKTAMDIWWNSRRKHQTFIAILTTLFMNLKS